MLTVKDGLDAIFLGCFLFGIVFSALSLVLGVGHLGIGHGHGGHGGHIGHGGDHGAHHGDEIGPLNLSTILAFIAWFGGVGYLARNAVGLYAPLSVAAGIGGGLVGAFVVFWALVQLVRHGDRPLDPADYQLPGTIARVTSSIRAGGTGEIVYEQAGVRQVSGARSADGRAIPRETEVVVLKGEDGVAIVEPWNAFVGERHADLATADGGRDGAAIRDEASVS